MLVFQLELGMFFEAKQSSSPAVFWLMWSGLGALEQESFWMKLS